MIKYKPDLAGQAYKLCLLGATDEELADFFGIDAATLGKWQVRHSEFAAALKKGKAGADAAVAQSLYRRAKGYYHPEDKVFKDGDSPMIVPQMKYYPPDTSACIFWLKNRQKEKWHEKIEQDIKAEMNIIVTPPPRPGVVPGEG